MKFLLPFGPPVGEQRGLRQGLLGTSGHLRRPHHSGGDLVTTFLTKQMIQSKLIILNAVSLIWKSELPTLA